MENVPYFPNGETDELGTGWSTITGITDMRGNIKDQR